MAPWRLIIDPLPRQAAMNMAIDSAILELAKIPTLRFYSWRPAAVSIGRFQCLKEEVDLQFCESNNIDVVRRTTGGGCVFHDQELTYSLVVPEENDFIEKDLGKSYEAICSCIIRGLANLAIKAEYAPINDILVDGKKISGCAQTRKKKMLLHHGTILLGIDPSKMFSALKVRDEKISDKGILDKTKRVTGIYEQLDREPTNEEIISAMAKGFTQQLGVNFQEQTMSKEEIALSIKRKDFFLDKDWIYDR